MYLALMCQLTSTCIRMTSQMVRGVVEELQLEITVLCVMRYVSCALCAMPYVL